MRRLLILGFALVAVALAQAPRDPATAVYYQIFVRSFQDSTGDGIGDLQGVIARLDYLVDLGVTGIWLMPIHPSPSYHGYDVTDYYAIHPDYGTLADFKALLEAAHARGISVILDLVVNHTSDRHPWFVAAKAGDPHYRDYYLWAEADPGWRGTTGGPAWHRAGDAYYLGLFWSGMPDLNYRNPAVVQEMEAIARYWLELGVDGFRIDAISHIVESEDGQIRNTPETYAWVEAFTAFVRSVNPQAFVLGETWVSPEAIVRYHQAGLDMSYNYPLYFSLIGGGGVTGALLSRSATDLAFMLAQDERLYPEGALRATFISNHDQIRPATSLSPLRRDVPRLKLAAGLLLTLPGTPFLYYGEEIGLPNGPGDRDEEKRTPMRWDATPQAGFTTGTPWHPLSTDDPAISVAAQQGDPDALLSWYRKLIALRRQHPVLFYGSTRVIDTGHASVLGLLRADDTAALVVLANLAAQPRDVDLSGIAPEPLIDLLSGEALGPTVSLPGLALVVLDASDVALGR